MKSSNPMQAYLCLVAATFFFGGNVVAGKFAVGEISPMAITMLRWVFAAAGLAFVARRSIPGHWRELVSRWPYMLAMGAIGFTAFNAMFYAAAHTTTAANMAIISGATPIFVIAIGACLSGSAPRPLQWVGGLLTFGGAVLAASHGTWDTLRHLSFSRGDLFMMVASIIYAVYTIGLRWRPGVPPLVFMLGLALAAFAAAVPLAVGEAMLGQFQWPTPKGWMILLFIALFPSLLCQVLYLRGVEQIGAPRAGVFYNLVPVFGLLLSVAVAGEPLRLYAGAALLLVLGGIAISELGRGGRDQPRNP